MNAAVCASSDAASRSARLLLEQAVHAVLLVEVIEVEEVRLARGPSA